MLVETRAGDAVVGNVREIGGPQRIPPGGGVYVGRPSRWGNPYSVATLGRDEAIRRYRLLVWHRIEQHGDRELRQLAALHGQILWCWCAPKPCHADVLVRAAAWAHEQLRRR